MFGLAQLAQLGRLAQLAIVQFAIVRLAIVTNLASSFQKMQPDRNLFNSCRSSINGSLRPRRNGETFLDSLVGANCASANPGQKFCEAWLKAALEQPSKCCTKYKALHFSKQSRGRYRAGNPRASRRFSTEHTVHPMDCTLLPRIRGESS